MVQSGPYAKSITEIVECYNGRPISHFCNKCITLDTMDKYNTKGWSGRICMPSALPKGLGGTVYKTDSNKTHGILQRYVYITPIS